MFTEIDERRGLVKTDWASVRARVARVEPEFAKLVDTLNPDKSYPLWLAYYRWGDLKGDTETPFLPTVDGDLYRLSDKTAPKAVLKHLGYGQTHSPMGMVLEKNFECFVDFQDEKVTIPRTLYEPGSIFSFSRNLGRHHKRVYSPNGVYNMMSGCRSVFMLPNIGSMTQHVHLQSDYNVKSPPAKTLYDHWQIFKEIVTNEIKPSDWRSCMLFFSEKWIEKLHGDKSWSMLKVYLQDLAWQHFEYDRNHIYYEIIYSLIQKRNNLKPNPYLVDTMRHLIAVSLGVAPGYAPANNEESLPLAEIITAFVESYRLEKYHAHIMQPENFIFETASHPVYYSLQYPSSFGFSPKARKVFSTLFEMRELAYIIKTFMNELAKENGICQDTVFRIMANTVNMHYFHNVSDRHQVIHSSALLPEFDSRFRVLSKKGDQKTDIKFASDGPFVRGCVGIDVKRSHDKQRNTSQSLRSQ